MSDTPAPVFSGTPEYGIPGYNYRDFIASHTDEVYELFKKGDDGFELKTPYATAEITIWDDEIVEFSITNNATGDNVYYLHFPLNDRERAESLYDELVAELLEQQNHRTVNVLLSCTSGWTTTMFAAKLNKGAKALSLDYNFDAVRAGDLYEQGMAHDVILLAPQVNYLYEKAKRVLREKPVVQIPTSVFATENVAAAIELVRNALQQKEEAKREPVACSCKAAPQRVLTMLARQTAMQTELAWQVIEGGQPVREDVMVKRGNELLHRRSKDGTRALFGLQDMIDLIASTLRTEPAGTRIDAIAIAMIGSVYKGVVTLHDSDFDGIDLEKTISERFGIPTVVVNNVNAAALGWYSQQDTYQTIVFHSQSRGLVVGGQGIIIDGHLHEGKNSLAGELQNFLAELPSPDAQLSAYHTSRHRVWDPDRIAAMLGQVFAVDVGIVAPEAICVRSLLTPDMDQIRAELSRWVPEDNQPDLIYIPRFTPYVYGGLLKLAQDLLDKNNDEIEKKLTISPKSV